MDKFFNTDVCDRCGRALNGTRKGSWFTEEALCASGPDNCIDKEQYIRNKLREQGMPDLEGCGFVPIVENSARFAVEE